MGVYLLNVLRPLLEMSLVEVLPTNASFLPLETLPVGEMRKVAKHTHLLCNKYLLVI